MKRWIISILIICIPITFIVAGKLIQQHEALYSLGGYCGLLGVVLFPLASMIVFFRHCYLKCPNCGAKTKYPRRIPTYFARPTDLVKCPKCQTIIEVNHEHL